jgi:ribosomal protein S18 acetylase RimI-like enzyme
MIKELQHTLCDVAKQIFTVFQRAYQVEAQLIGATIFPPLARNVHDIKKSNTQFFGYYDDVNLAAVIEVEVVDHCLEIHSVTVDPDYFKRGIASKLIQYILALQPYSSAVVETATANTPAIELYQKLGFKEFKRWTPAHGIEKLALKKSYVMKVTASPTNSMI